MSRHSAVLRARSAITVAATALGILTISGCGSLVEVSSHITPVPPNCATPRPVAAVDSFTTPVAVQTAASGLETGDISMGCGPAAGTTGTVHVQFTVWMQNGTRVITTRGPGQPPNSLALGDPQTLAFWRLGVPGMRVGGIRRLIVPPALAFGTAGNSSAGVPPNTTLVIDVELVSVG
jgi:FKBP-type peptidyl-prolyl cis-trans isomerase FkpA